jgi:putative flippase GtrA
VLELENDVIINTYPLDFRPEFSLLISVSDEMDSVEKFVMQNHEKIKNYKIEIILSENGNKNNKTVIQNLTKKYQLKAVLSNHKKEYLEEIKDGLKHASAPYIMFSESDMQHSLSDFLKLKDKMTELNFRGNVIISGSRNRRKITNKNLRSKIFQKMTSLVFDLPTIDDIVSGCKLMDTNLAKTIIGECKFMKENFWAEFTIRACNKKIEIIEVLVQYVSTEREEIMLGNKKSKIPNTITSNLKSIVRLKRDLSGKGFFHSMIQTTLVKQLFKFALVGASGAGIILFLTWVGVNHGLNYMISALFGIEVSICWAFAMNNRITFGRNHQSKLIHRFLKYHIIALAGEGLNLSILYILTTTGIFYLFSEALAILIVFFFNFTISKKWIWKR